MQDLLKRFEGGDRRSLRGVPEVVHLVEKQPSLFPVLIDGLTHANPLVRMRSADAAEKLTVEHPEYLAPFKGWILRLLAEAREKEVRWHLAQMLPRLPLTARDRRRALEILETYATDESSIVRTFAMQAMADIAEADPAVRPAVTKRLRELMEDGSPAMKSRGRKLLARLRSL